MKRLTFLFFLVIAVAPHSHADLYSPNRQLFEIKTKYFTIIFPEESRAAASYLATFADDTYMELARLLNTKPKIKMAVVITPDSEELNGYFNPLPYPHIVLYQAVIDINSSLGSFDNNFYKLFYHELAHAVSLTIRSGPEDFIASIFGQALSMPFLAAPYNFVEGVTVSLESSNGHGRAMDPLVGAELRQDILEGRFKSFVQSMGSYDLYPFGTVYYHYGGYFSRYLQERFGMENYARIWTRFGIGALFSPFDKGLFSKGSFYQVFGISLEEAWKDFSDWMAIKTPVVTSSQKLTEASYMSALAASGTRLYWHDPVKGLVFSLDTESKKQSPLFKADKPVNRIDASGDDRLLLSTQEEKAGLPRLVLKEWEPSKGIFTQIDIKSVRDAVYTLVPGTYLGILTDGYMTHLGFFSGKSARILARGTESLSYASPVISKDGKELFCLVKENGTNSILKISFDSSLGEINSAERLVLPKALSWIRYLSLSENGALSFAWDNDKLYRLVELRNEKLSWQNMPISGGVHYPVYANGQFFYIGRFSQGQSLCSMPEDWTLLEFMEAEAQWEDASGLLGRTSLFEKQASTGIKPYNPLPWLLPRLWLPLASVDSEGISSFGAITIIADPIESYSMTLSSEWNTRVEGLNTNLELSMMLWQPSLSLKLADNFVEASSWFRLSEAFVGLGNQHSHFGGLRLGYTLSGGVAAYARIEPGLSAYQPWTDASLIADGLLSLSYTKSSLESYYEPSGYSVALKLTGTKAILPETQSPDAGTEIKLAAAIQPFSAAIYAAARLAGKLGYGPSGMFLSGIAPASNFYPHWKEFMDLRHYPYYSQAELSLKILSLEIQRAMGSLYLNRLSFKIGSRAYASFSEDFSADSRGLSLFGRTELTLTAAYGILATIHPALYFELWTRPDLEKDGSIPHGFDLKIALPL
ncbi:hypothetical protein MASR2M29_06750 [Spirochaetota bacterium]